MPPLSKYAIALLAAALSISGAEFQAGTARAKITPEVPFWLSGFAARTHAGTSVRQDLWAKALALEDGKGGRIVIVTTDLIGLPPEVSDAVAARCATELHLKREQLWLNSSHTHSGPVVWPILPALFDLNPADTERTKTYAEKLKTQLVEVVRESLQNLSPAQIAYGSGTAGFAINRRASQLTDMKVNDPRAPVDHSVPVLRIESPDGKLRAILFGYACHNTTLTGTFYEISGDYAGYAQAALERAHPGVQAMFVLLCGGDQNPSPRSKLELAEKHGNELASSVETVLSGSMKTLHPPIRTAFLTTSLEFTPHTRAMFEEEAKSTNAFKARRAKLMLEDYDRGRPMRSIAYPVQAIRFDNGLAIVTLGGEVVVDYALRAKREHPNTDLVVAGYSNAVMSYIPSLRVLREGGYEASDSMIYYGRPGPYTENVEETVFHAIDRVLAKVGIRR
jgi:neutral ceramidase